jgi:dihydrofolate synthase/folylpolyglutamate synthase
VTIRTIPEAEAALLPYVPLVAQLTGKDTTLKRILPLMKLLGNPQERLRIVHLAGTSGKTSTAYYMAGLLQAGGLSIGLTVSPHVDSITERVQVNGHTLTEIEFCSELEIFLEIIKQASQPPSYFELLYAFALWEFERQKVDYAVVETGLGGLYDATNVTSRADKVCIITDIGYDHMRVLGNTLGEIASQKIGIVHQGNHVFMYQQNEEIMQPMWSWVEDHHATMTTTTEAELRTRDEKTQLTSLPPYQQRNWLLARWVYTYLEQRDGLSHLTSKALIQTQRIQVPGRMDVSHLRGKTVVMDGAHNAQKMTAFVQSFQVQYPGVIPAICVALKEDKEYKAVGPILAALGGRIIVTTFNTSQDLPARSINPQLLAETFKHFTNEPVECLPDQLDALDSLLSGSEEVCIITGSFYLLSQIRKVGA